MLEKHHRAACSQLTFQAFPNETCFERYEAQCVSPQSYSKLSQNGIGGVNMPQVLQVGVAKTPVKARILEST